VSSRNSPLAGCVCSSPFSSEMMFRNENFFPFPLCAIPPPLSVHAYGCIMQ
jgi:hypothetical protein